VTVGPRDRPSHRTQGHAHGASAGGHPDCQAWSAALGPGRRSFARLVGGQLAITSMWYLAHHGVAPSPTLSRHFGAVV